MKLIRVFAVICTVLALGGCASEYMVKSTNSGVSSSPDKATVVFMRPSSFGGAIQSSVYLVAPDQKGQDFVGVVSSKTKIAFPVSPGRHLFMVIAENADFMDAELEAGKTYYALVSPRIGVWKARFSLLPIHDEPSAKYSTASDDFKQWQADTHYVEKAPSADAWYESSRASIDEKRADYLKKWNARTAADKADLFLHPNDGTP